MTDKTKKTEKIKDYILINPIKEGGNGIVYKAFNEKDKKFYAIKKVEKEKIYLEREINQLQELNDSKYSVNYKEYIIQNNINYIVMELCDGDLNDLLESRNGNLDIVTIIKITNQLNEVLKKMLDLKIEHRDLKPGNILIKYINEKKTDFEIKLTDYGCSKFYNKEEVLGATSKFSEMVGTDFYMAPEIFQNKGDSRSDLWSIGMILYDLYFNQIPFKNKDEYINSDVLLKETDYEDLNDLLNKLIVKDPDKRIKWDDYFEHPFNNQQIIEIVINNEKDNNNIKIIDNEFFKCEQLKDSKIFIDRYEEKFNNNFILNKGRHTIDIVFKNNLTNCNHMFSKCQNITQIKFFNLRTNEIKDMSYMFNGCSELLNLDLSCFKTKNVTNMSGMFNQCSKLKELDLIKFDTKNVTNMSGMFNECLNLEKLELSSFNTGNVRDMSYMFNECSKLKIFEINIKNFKTNNVLNKENMFNNCKYVVIFSYVIFKIIKPYEILKRIFKKKKSKYSRLMK